MKANRELCRRTRLRQVKYLNNFVEQDHRDVQRLVRTGMGFGSFRMARRMLAGCEAMSMMRKGQVSGRAMSAQARFVAELLPISA